MIRKDYMMGCQNVRCRSALNIEFASVVCYGIGLMIPSLPCLKRGSAQKTFLVPFLISTAALRAFWRRLGAATELGPPIHGRRLATLRSGLLALAVHVSLSCSNPFLPHP